MSTYRIKKAIRAGWDAMSDSYQSETRISLDEIHYAPLCPGERELRLIGDVKGRRVLELACGAAQNSIALARWGAEAVALDFSPRQLSRARVLASREGADVSLVCGDMEELGMFRDGSFDLVLSSFGWEFVPDLGACFQECHRVLRSGGLLLVCTVHPLSAFQWDEQERHLLVTDYFHIPVEVWEDSGEIDGQHPLTFYHTFEDMFRLLTSSRFTVEDVVEPYPYPIHAMSETERRAIPYTGDFWEKQYERLARVPFAIIYKARKL